MNGEKDRSWISSKAKSCNVYLFALIVFYMIYVLLGAMVFMLLEEEEDKKMGRNMRDIYQKFLKSQSSNLNESELQNLFVQVVESLKNGDSIQVLWTKSDGPLGSNWSFDQTLLFAVSVVTLIGYGNMTPKTPPGKVFTVVFAIVGIPMTFLIVAAIVQRIIFVSSKFYYFVNNSCFSGHRASISWVLYCFVFFLVVLTMFFLLPSSIFYYLEREWSYWDSFYFCFVSLTTIGFGDYVPAKDYTYEYKGIYTVCITFYLLTGIIFLMALIEEVYKTPIIQQAIMLCSYAGQPPEDLKDQELNIASKEHKPGPLEPYDNKGYHSFDDQTVNPLNKT